jgi:hypothetical protein
MDEMDPTLTVLEHAKEAAQQKYLYALKDSVTNVEFTAHLIALQQQQSTMSAVDDSCLQHECLKEDQKESTASTPCTARRRQRIALARFVKKIKRRAEDSARAEAPRTPDTSGADINPAAEGWRTWNSSETSGSADLIDLPTWLDQRHDRAEEYEGLGYTNTVSSFAASRHWERRAQRSEEAEYQQLTNSERRSQQRTRRAFQPEEAKEDCFTVFKAFDATRARKAMMNYKSGIKLDKKVKFKRGDSPAMKTMLNELAAALPKSKFVSGERRSIVDSGTTVTIMNDEDALDDIDLTAVIKIMGFNASVSRSKGRGTTFGYARSADGRQVVPLKIMNVHHVPGAPHDLLSVSSMVLLGYEFHFKRKNAYVITPGGDRLELLHEKGLYWLKWRRAVDPNATRPGVVKKNESGGTSTTVRKKKSSARQVRHEAPKAEDSASFLNMVDQADSTISAGMTSTCSHHGCARCNLTRVGGQKTPSCCFIVDLLIGTLISLRRW